MGGWEKQGKAGRGLVLAKWLILPKLPCAACTSRPPKHLGMPAVTLLLGYLDAGDRGSVSSHTHTHTHTPPNRPVGECC